LRERYQARIEWLLAHNERKSWQLKSFVLTTDWTLEGDDYGRARVRQLHAAAKKLAKHFWGMKGAGAFAGWEVGPKGGRLHVHGVAFGPYVPHAELSAKWQELTGCPVVWIRRVTPSEAVREGIKYIAKLSKRDEGGAFVMQPADLARLHVVLKGRRRVWCWGAFYNLKAAEVEAEQELTEEDTGAGADMCERGHRMVFLRVAEVRQVLYSKGAINCPAWPAPGAQHAAPMASGPP
jgi:hypothetical protein